MGHGGSDGAGAREGQLYQRKGSPYWWCHLYSATGERLSESTRTRDKRAALAYLRRREREEQEPGAAERRAATLRSALKALVDDRQIKASSETGSRSKATVHFYLAKSARLLAHFGEAFLLRDVTAAAVDGYVAARRLAKRKDSTIHKELTTLRAALKIAKRAGLWSGDLETVLPHDVSGASTPCDRWLTHAELDRVLADLIEKRPRKDRAARVAFVVATSAEWSATVRARREDVSRDGAFVHIRGEKRDTRARDVPIVRPWQRELLAFALEHADGRDGLLFKPWTNSNSNRELDWCAARLAIEPFGWNDLRRTCAQWLRADGVALEIVSAVLGHADGRMVERVYGRLNAATLAARMG